MKKFGVVLFFFLLVFGASFVFASNHTNSSGSSSDSGDKVDDAFSCLEDKVGSCTGLSVQEVALTILATPDDDVFDDCVDELLSRRSSNNWGNVRDTALAVLALDHAGEDTEASEEWLLDQTLVPTDLVWFLEQDSNEAVECHIGYDAQDFTVLIGDNKKIDRNAGSCLTRAQSNFWFQIDDACYDHEFILECDKDFIATLLYKNQNSPTIHVLDGTQSSPAFGSLTLSVNASCFGGSSCDYEASAWATLALLRTGHDVEVFLPYLIALADTHERFLPDAFVYMATNFEDYADDLVSDVQLGNFWLADGSAYNKFYDTSLAIIALGSSSSSEQVNRAKDWLLFSQGSNGCWQNSVRETAIVLWALEGRSGRAHGGGSGSAGGVTYCSEAGYFCIPSSECPASENVGNNFFCSSLSETCCTSQNLQSCSALGGSICTGDSVCTGNERRSLDSDFCCTGECVARPQQTECEQSFYTCMDTSCSDAQEPVVGYACSVGQVCCRARTTSSDDSGGSLWWLWLLLILLIILLILAIVFRKRLQAWFNDRKNRKGKGKPGPGKPGKPGIPPGRVPPRGRPGVGARPGKPGFPPIRRRAPIVAPPRKRMYGRRDPQMSETFRKLKEMSDKK